MTAHMRLQRISTRVIARLALALAPLAHILGLLRTAGGAMHALHMSHELVVVHRVAEIAVFP